jgi:prephenate dehydratase
VRHCLLGHSPSNSGSATSTSKNEPVPQKPAPKPVSDLSNIKKIYSHPQVWGQCKAFLNTYLKGIERQDVSSTSRAAELVSEDESGESVAISSVIAAQIHGLDVLAQGIEDSPDNTTRFFVIRKAGSTTTRTKASQKVGGRASFDDDDEKVAQKDSKDWKTLISFTVDHANPGSLAHSLSVFEKYGLNLTSINTRPSGVENWNYIFLVEIKGRKIEGTEDDEDGDVNRALRDLDGVCGGRRWLGSWENRLVR